MKKRLLTLILGAAVCMAAQTGRAAAMDKMEMGTYQEYSESAFSKAADKNRVLFFHASWCPYCRQGDMALQKTHLPENVAVFKVDFDNADALKAKYGVSSQNTFVLVDSKGNKVTTWKNFDQAMSDHFMADGMMMKKDGMMKDSGMMKDAGSMMKKDSMMDDGGMMNEPMMKH